MADRSIVVKLRADVADFDKSMAQAAKSTEKIGKGAEDAAKKSGGAFATLKKSATENRAAWDQTGAALTGFGAGVVGALGLAAKSAMDWESAWAGVVKTVDGSPEQMAALEGGLRGLARELPATHTEIAAVAEAAGQLGIETPNILGFTRTMINMGEATNLSADEAATSLARFINITGTGQQDIGKLGAAIVGLGNNYATTESEILALSMRLAGAGAQAGLTEGDILGISAAMSSVGIEAEAGGSAMSMTMKRIGKSVDEGGESLELFSQVSGMTAEEFSAAWKNDPTVALDSFITGLSSVEEQGLTTNGVLAELGITGIRESDSLLRLSAAAGQGADGMSLLASAVSDGNAEFDKGSALIEEAAKRYETAESRIQMAKNALVDFGISVGGAVLPALAGLAAGAGDMAGWFADLPGPVHEAAAGLGAVVGVSSLAAGGFLLLFPRIMDTVASFKQLNSSTNGMAGTVGKIGLSVGVAAAAFPLLVSGARAASDAIQGIDRASLDVGMAEMTSRTLEAADATSAYDSLLGDLADSGALNTKQFDNLGSSISKVADMDAMGKFGHSIGLASGGMDLLVTRLSDTGDALAVLYQSDLPAAQSSFQSIWAEAEAGGASFDQLLEVMPAFKEELQTMANLMGEDATDSATLLKIATGELSPVIDEATGAMTGVEDASGDMAAGLEGGTEAVEEQVDALAELQDLLQGTSDLMLGVRGSARSFEEAMDAASAAVEENGKTLDITTEAGRANEAALDGIASATQDWANSAEEAGASAEELDGIMAAGRENFISTAEAMGMSTAEATALADELQLMPEFVSTEVKVETQTAIDAAMQLPTVLAGIFEEPFTADVDADTAGAIEKTYGFEEVINGATADKSVNVGANVEPASNEVNRLALAVNSAGGTITVNGNTVPADSALDTIMGIINNSDGTVTIDGQSYPADQALNAAIAMINRSGGTVDIDGNNAGARGATDSAVGHANSSSGSIKVNANASSANSAINNAARTRTARINVTYSDPGFKGGGGSSRFATGGAVQGPGSWTSDSIPALLSNGEHVITAAEVARAGGQDAIYRMRAAINSGLKFADGGGVENGSYARSPVIRNEVMRPSSSDGSNVGGQIAAAMSSWQPIVNIDGREFSGLMMQGNRRIKSMGGR